MINSKTVLVTGATGFVGSCLSHRLVSMDCDLHITKREESDIWRIKDIFNRIVAHDVDLIDNSGVEKLVRNIKPQIIFHTAAYGGYPFQKDVSKIIGTNVMGTFNLVSACSEVGFSVFVNTGSSSEYGVKSKLMNEIDLLEPDTNYGAGKAAATLFCQAKARSGRLPIVTLRLFSPYGYYEELMRLVPSVIIACLAGKNPKVSCPEPVRDFVFIEDVLDAYVKAANVPNIGGEIFNIGYGQQHSVGEVVDKTIELIEGKVNPEWGGIPTRTKEPTIWQADISKARDTLKWEPKHNLEEGLRKTVRWFEENLSLYKEMFNQELEL